MSYSDGTMILGPELATAEFETAATLKDYELPFAYQIEEFGVVVTEAMTAQATDSIWKVQKLTTGGTPVDVITLTIGNSNTNLKKGDGTKEAQTAISVDTDLAAGSVVLCPRSTLPVSVTAHTVLRIAVTTGQTGAGGAGVPFVIIRPQGIDSRSTAVFTDVS